MEVYGESNNDDMQEGRMEMMIDLAEAAGDLLGMNASINENGDDDGDKDGNDGGPFIALK